MLAGRVQRIDEKRQTIHIERRGRVYPAPWDEVEPEARVPSALVEFRVVRRQGQESAVDARLRVGTRTNRRQRRSGDPTAARRPGSNVATDGGGDYGIDVASPPFDVVEAWLEAMSDRDLDGAAALYLPDAILHRAGGDLAGRGQIRAGLETSPFAGIDTDEIDLATDIYGLGRYVRVDARFEDAEHGLSFVVDRGAITEQWLDVEPLQPDAAPAVVPIQLVVRGPVDDGAQTYADRRMRHVVETLGRPVRFSRLKLTAIDNPASERPAVAESVLDLDRTMIRARADAATHTEAVDRVIERLQDQVAQSRGRRRTRQRGRVAAHDSETWPPAEVDRRFRSEASPPSRDRPEVVRHRSFAPDDLTVEEAAWDLDLLDYDFLLFVESVTGDDALLERVDSGPRLLHLRNRPEESSTIGEELDPDLVVLAGDQPQELTSAEAIDLLEGAGEPFRFYVDRASGRANVVYRRLDGHYGLITPP